MRCCCRRSSSGCGSSRGRGFVQRAIAGQARELGLAEDEAGLIAAAMLAGSTLEHRCASRSRRSWPRGRLRTAQRLAAGLPADDPLRRAGRGTWMPRSPRSSAAADQELAAGHGASGRPRCWPRPPGPASDDAGLAERLAALPPPPPRNARRPGGRGSRAGHLGAQPGPGRAACSYRVMRGQDRAPVSPAEGTAVAAPTERTDVTDAERAAGADLFYSVFADRGGETWSPPATAPAGDVRPGRHRRLGHRRRRPRSPSPGGRIPAPTPSWSRAARAARRAEPDDGTAVEASLAGFTDTGLRTGTEYFYRIAASYRAPDGGRRQSAGIVVPAVPEPEPEAVTDLDVGGAGRRHADGRGQLDAAAARPGAAGAERRAAALAGGHPHQRRRTRPGSARSPGCRGAAPTAATPSNCACRPGATTCSP